MIDDIKVIRHLPSKIDLPDDASYPFKLEVNLRPPELMQVAFVMLCGGSEEIVVRAATRSALDAFISDNELRAHPRLRWMRITGPAGVINDTRETARTA